jgi:hypothetical protein
LKGKESTLKRELECLELQVETDKNKNIDDNKYAQFYSYIYTGTNSRKARVERGNFIYREIIEPVKEL